jgi:hypothetical protein
MCAKTPSRPGSRPDPPPRYSPRVPKPRMQTIASRAVTALQDALQTNFNVSLNAQGYATRLEDVLLPGVERADFETDLNDGAGKELEGKFLAPHSSAQLAVNAFSPFRRRLTDLRIAGLRTWTTLRFEGKCNLWPDYRGTPAHLDLLLRGPAGVLGIESKCTEYFAHKPAMFAQSYHVRIDDDRRRGAWFRELERLSAEPHAYRFLDAAQLVKHAFGLGHTYPTGDVTLLYLYWEPENGDSLPEIATHRREIADFASRVAGDRITFASESYLDLWRDWSSSGIAWVKAHAAQLARRYGVPV